MRGALSVWLPLLATSEARAIKLNALRLTLTPSRFAVVSLDPQAQVLYDRQDNPSLGLRARLFKDRIPLLITTAR